jgi:hypothetical protein
MNSETGFSSKLRRLTALFTCLRNDPRGTRHRARNIAPPSCESVARRCRPMASSPRILNRHRQGQTPRLCKKTPVAVHHPPRAQASRRCETQATLAGKPPSFATVSVP